MLHNSFLELQTPDFAWKFVETVPTNYEKKLVRGVKKWLPLGASYEYKSATRAKYTKRTKNALSRQLLVLHTCFPNFANYELKSTKIELKVWTPLSL